MVRCHDNMPIYEWVKIKISYLDSWQDLKFLSQSCTFHIWTIKAFAVMGCKLSSLCCIKPLSHCFFSSIEQCKWARVPSFVSLSSWGSSWKHQITISDTDILLGTCQVWPFHLTLVIACHWFFMVPSSVITCRGSAIESPSLLLCNKNNRYKIKATLSSIYDIGLIIERPCSELYIQ